MATIVVTGRDAEITSRNKQHAEEKLAKLERYHSGITRIEAVLGHNAEGAEAELVISVRRRRKAIVCHGKAKELYAAIDVVLDKAEGQLTRIKERSQDRKKRSTGSAAGGQAAGAADEEDKLESYEDIVEKTDFSQ